MDITKYNSVLDHKEEMLGRVRDAIETDSERLTREQPIDRQEARANELERNTHRREPPHILKDSLDKFRKRFQGKSAQRRKAAQRRHKRGKNTPSTTA